MNAYPQLYNLVRDRYSCRGYDPARPVDADSLMATLDIARLAPSAVNRQPWMFVVADSEADLTAVAKSYPREWIKSAPVCIIACGDHSGAWHRPADGKDHTDVDVSIAVTQLCLGATALGLATCWVCNFDTDIIRSHFNLPDHLEPVALIPLGYPLEAPSERHPLRKSLEEIVHKGPF